MKKVKKNIFITGGLGQDGKILTYLLNPDKYNIFIFAKRKTGNMVKNCKIFYENLRNKIEPYWLLKDNIDNTHSSILWQQAIATYPAFLTELLLLQKCGNNLAAIVTGQQDPQSVMFTDSTAAENLYTYAETFHIYNVIVTKVIKYITQATNQHKVLKILEVGAGTGGTTSFVLPHLPAFRVEYTYTDISQFFLNSAQQKFAAYKFVDYQLLDISQDPLQQGFALESYDIVIAANVSHATPDVSASLTIIKSLLAPSGMLLMMEMTNKHTFFDLVFGVYDDLWKFTDYDLRSTHPLLQQAQF